MPGEDMALAEALAADYDGTLAHEGVVDAATLSALERWRASGRRLVLVTGRQLPHLARIFPEHDGFDAVVAENGAVFAARGKAPMRLAGPPPDELVEALRARCGEALAVGSVIVAAPRACEPAVRATLAELRLPWRVILNKSSLMCLPPGVDKGAGLFYALGRLGLEPRRALGVGDAENDLDFLRLAGVFAVVGNALPELKAVADVVAPAEAGAGVAWLIERALSVSRPAVRTATGRSGG